MSKLDKLIEKGEEVLKTHTPNSPGVIGFPTLDSGKFNAWKTQCLNYLKGILPENSAYIENFKKHVEKPYKSQAKSGIDILKCVKEDLDSGELEKKKVEKEPLEIIENICSKFHIVTRQLRSRYNNRSTLDVKDEYDVQDLLHSLLYINFEDVRPEEWTPSYAGKSARVDFLIKNVGIVIEVKKSRRGLNAKKLGDQLIEDIARYKEHPNCDQLICFVYDPEGLISNPRGIENDLNRSDSLAVRVLIRP